MRLSHELREALEASAKQAGRDLSEEIRVRLDASFNTVELGSSETRCLAIVFERALEIEREQTGFAWFEQAWAWDRARQALDEVFTFFKPTGDPAVVPSDAALLKHIRSIGVQSLVEEATEQLKDTALGRLSGRAAIALLESVADGAGPPDLQHLKETAAEVKTMLERFDNDSAALTDLKAAFPAVGSGRLLRKVTGAPRGRKKTKGGER